MLRVGTPGTSSPKPDHGFTSHVEAFVIVMFGTEIHSVSNELDLIECQCALAADV